MIGCGDPTSFVWAWRGNCGEETCACAQWDPERITGGDGRLRQDHFVAARAASRAWGRSPVRKVPGTVICTVLVATEPKTNIWERLLKTGGKGAKALAVRGDSADRNAAPKCECHYFFQPLRLSIGRSAGCWVGDTRSRIRTYLREEVKSIIRPTNSTIFRSFMFISIDSSNAELNG
jgi:hypothetical protein